jgi:hypothetical protein
MPIEAVESSGSSEKGQMEAELRSLCATLGLSSRVSFLGSKDRDATFGEITSVTCW